VQALRHRQLAPQLPRRTARCAHPRRRLSRDDRRPEPARARRGRHDPRVGQRRPHSRRGASRIVIEPSDEERAAHDQLLALIAKTSGGKLLWSIN
jgi:hypothetical protein